MPKPLPNEKESDYISRCIPIVIKEGTAKDSKQASAICYSMWREKHKQSESGERVLLHLCAQLSLKKPEMDTLDKMVDHIGELDRSTILVGEGVYNGIFFPSDEIEKSYLSWDRQPINLNHSDAVEDIVGYVTEPMFDKVTKKFSVKPVLDPSTSKYGIANGYITSRFNAGSIPEISIGVWCSKDFVEEERKDGATFIAKDLEGDHLALVTRGACSPKQGCGIGLNSYSFSVDVPITDYEFEKLEKQKQYEDKKNRLKLKIAIEKEKRKYD